MVEQEVGQYRIVRLIGEGGMGQVFQAIDRSGRPAAIKVLRPEYASDSQMAARFVNEARAIRLVEHPGVVTIFDVGVLPSGAAYIAMEYLAGISLRDHIRGPAPPHPQCLDLVHQIATTLAVVHARQIIHRDLKPENILLVSDPKGGDRLRAKVLDFGIAKLASPDQAGGVKTQTGVLMGTPTYMAPEQCGGPGEICDRTDVYALGIMLYEMLAGQPPFCGEQDSQIIGRHLFVQPQPINERLPSIDPRLAMLIHRTLAKAPKERPAMVAVSAELEQIQRSNPKEFRALPTSLLLVDRLSLLQREHISTLTQATGQSPPRRPPDRWLLLLCTSIALLLGALLPWTLKGWRARPEATLPAASPTATGDTKRESVSVPGPGPVASAKPDPWTKPSAPAAASDSPAPAQGLTRSLAPPTTRRLGPRPGAPKPPLTPLTPAAPAKSSKHPPIKNLDVRLFR